MDTKNVQRTGVTGPRGDTRKGKRDLRPLARLLPYLLRYRVMLAGALIALLAASAATLAIPTAVRRVIDHGFSGENPEFVDKYFAMLILVGLVLAVSSAARYYFVSWIGERVVSEIIWELGYS